MATNWLYSQLQGVLVRPDGVRYDGLYSGFGGGVNNPEMEDVAGIGPIPQGRWTFGEPFDDPETGPLCLALAPAPGTYTFNRGGFVIHGDEVEHPGEHLASHGCIVAPRAVREALAASTWRLIEVVEQLD